MLELLEPHIAAGRLSVEVLDIDRHPDLLARYGSLIPVLLANGREIAHYALSEQQLLELLTENTFL